MTTCYQKAVGQYLDVPPDTVPADIFLFDEWLSAQGYYRATWAFSRWREAEMRVACVLLTKSQQHEGALHATYVGQDYAVLKGNDVVAVEVFRRYADDRR